MCSLNTQTLGVRVGGGGGLVEGVFSVRVQSGTHTNRPV